VKCATIVGDQRRGAGSCGAAAAKATVRPSHDEGRLEVATRYGQGRAVSAEGAGHSRLLSTGRVQRGERAQSPATPLLTIRNRSGPNAEDPNAFAGSSVATATLEFWSVIRRYRLQGGSDHDPSVVATSIFSSRVKDGGVCARSENVSCASCGSSS